LPDIINPISKTMKKVRIAIIILVALSAFLIIKCDKKSDSAPENQATTVEQDKANIDNSLDGILDCATFLKNGDAAYSVKLFLKMSGGEALSEDWVQMLLDKLDIHFNWDMIEENGRFDLMLIQGLIPGTGSQKFGITIHIRMIRSFWNFHPMKMKHPIMLI